MEIELYSKMQNPIDAIDKMGEFFARSGLFGCDNVCAGKVLATICMSERKSPVDLLRTYDIVEGKLRKKAMAAFAEFRAKGGKVKWLKTGDDGIEASAVFSFEGQEVPLTFTIAQAQKAGLVKAKSGWEKSPGNMLRARLISNALGMLCPELFAGEDYSEEPDRPAPAINMAAIPVEVISERQSAQPITATDNAGTAAAGAQIVVEAGPTQSAPPVPQSAPTSGGASAATAAPSFPAGPAYETPKNATKLAPQMVEQVKAVIGDHMTSAFKWMVANGYLTQDQGLDCLTESRAKRILKNAESFIRALETVK